MKPKQHPFADIMNSQTFNLAKAHKRGRSEIEQLVAINSELLELFKRGLECGIFDDAPVYRADVKALIKKATGGES